MKTNQTKAEKGTDLLDHFNITDNFVWRRCSNDWLRTWSTIIVVAITCRVVRITVGVRTTVTATIARCMNLYWIGNGFTSIVIGGLVDMMIIETIVIFILVVVTCTGNISELSLVIIDGSYGHGVTIIMITTTIVVGNFRSMYNHRPCSSHSAGSRSWTNPIRDPCCNTIGDRCRSRSNGDRGTR